MTDSGGLPQFTLDDRRFMARALQLAERGLYTTDPNPRVGCVVVKEGQVVAEGWHERAGEAHAEINALQVAGDASRNATIYLTLEPCCHEGRTPPCTSTLIKTGIRRVVAAMPDPNPRVAGKGFDELRRAGITVEAGLLQDQAESLNPGFISRMRRDRPYVRAKLAVSMDGRSAMADGESKWITGEDARTDVQRWRARSGAIMTGSGTVLSDDPSLNVRAFDIRRQPLRIVVDSRLRMPDTARMLHLGGNILVVTETNDAKRAEMLRRKGAEVLHLPSVSDGIDLVALMRHLAAREINELLLEAGATLCGAMLQQNLLDEIILYFAPHLMGSDARPMFHLPGLERMADRIDIDIVDVRAVGKDWRMIAKVM